MNWGLTRFERKRIERIALDHPYFDMHAPLLTKKELRTILAQGPHKTGPQVIAEVKKELGLNDAPVIQQNRTLIDALHDASFVPSFRRTVILSTLGLLLALFMTLTVPGRALAEEVYSIIVDFVDGTLGIRNSTPATNQQAPSFSMLEDDLASPEALAAVLKYPIVASRDPLISFEYELIGKDILSIRTQYHTLSEKKYTIIQELHGDNSLWSFSVDATDDDYQRIEPINGIELYSGIASDGKAYVIGYSTSYTIKISGSKLTLPEVISIAEHVIVYNNE